MSYEEYVGELAVDVIAETRRGKPGKAFVRSFYARIGEAGEHGRSSAQAYDDVGARVRAAARQRLLEPQRRTVKLWTEVVGTPKESTVNLEDRHLARLPALRASLEGPLAPRVPPAGRGAGEPHAAVVILSYDRLDYLKTTLAAFHETIAYDAYELIVVDNGSRDGSAQFLREAAARGLCSKVILRKKNHGIAPGYNIGFAHARPDAAFYVKLDCDILSLSRGWIRRFAGIFDKNPRIGALAMNIVNHAPIRNLPDENVGGDVLLDLNAFVAGGAGMTIPGKVFRELGYFREDFDLVYMPDDVDYNARLVRAGYDGYYVKDVHAFHRTDLDEVRFRDYGARKAVIKTEYQRALQSIGRSYDRRERPLRTVYPRYEGLAFPPGENVIEVD